MNPQKNILVMAVICFGLMLPQAALAGLDVDFGANVRLSDDTDLFFNISSRYSGHDPQVVGRLGARYSNPDDLSVALFLSKRSGQDPMDVYRLRDRGMSWFDISVRYGVPMDAWFVPVRRQPGPPYGKAYGHWKNKSGAHISDQDARNLVAVRMIHEYYGVPVETAMEWRAGGRTIREITTGEYRKRHGKSSAAGKSSKGHGNGKGHGQGKKNGKNK
jgi:hypothetical protein